MEIWKPIITAKEDYVGYYEVSNLGRVKSLAYQSALEKLNKQVL